MTVITARLLALQILDKYEPQKTNLSQLINKTICECRADIEKGFVRELVWGVIKYLNSIDWLIEKFCTTPDKLKKSVRNILRLGIFQLLYFSDRVPEYAAVNESVDLVRTAGQPNASKLVNAVLREVIRSKDKLPWPDEKEQLSKKLSLEYSHPEWLVSRWLFRFGQKETTALCMANNNTPKLCVRANTLKITREHLGKVLKEEGVLSEFTHYSPDGLRLLSNPEIEKLKSYQSGLFLIQDEASQIVSRILDPKENETILDLCSGKGVKTACIAQLCANKAKITAVDNSDEQIKRARENISGLKIENIEFINSDARDFKGIKADRILLDAPCSGLGTIRRKPDIKWNRAELDIVKRFPWLQKQILFNAASLLKKDGVLVYSTCSTEPEENEGVVECFLQEHPEFQPEKINFPGLEVTDKGYLYTFPNKHGLDGFFAAKMKKI